MDLLRVDGVFSQSGHEFSLMHTLHQFLHATALYSGPVP